jgi:hypothetical protein
MDHLEDLPLAIAKQEHRVAERISGKNFFHQDRKPVDVPDRRSELRDIGRPRAYEDSAPASDSVSTMRLVAPAAPRPAVAPPAHTPVRPSCRPGSPEGARFRLRRPMVPDRPPQAAAVDSHRAPVDANRRTSSGSVIRVGRTPSLLSPRSRIGRRLRTTLPSIDASLPSLTSGIDRFMLVVHSVSGGSGTLASTCPRTPESW